MARKKRTYNGLTVNITSRKAVEKSGRLAGYVRASVMDGDAVSALDFDEVEGDKALVIVGERKWIPIKINKQFGIRVTKNKETGEYRILCSLTREKLQSMTLRECGELEMQIGLMIEKIRL